MASEIFDGFHSIRMPVPVDPLRYSPPLGNTSASEATDGSVESTVKVTDPLAELPSWSTAVNRILAVGESSEGTVQAAFPELATSEATGVHELPSEEYSTVIGLETGEASEA